MYNNNRLVVINMPGRKDPCKSAPTTGRRKSVTEKKKSTTMKDINNWIQKDGVEPVKRSCVRSVNQLTENVTEERMLYARQLELGRERYKFLVSHEYEKNRFVERQQCKDKMMKKYMTSARKIIEKTYADRPKKTLTIRIPQVEFYTPSTSPTAEDSVVARSESRVSRASRDSKRSPRRVATSIPRLDSRSGTRFMVQNKEGNKSAGNARGTKSQSCERPPAKEITFIDYSTPDGKSVEETCASQLQRLHRSQTMSMHGRGVYVNTSLEATSQSAGKARSSSSGRLPSMKDNSTCCAHRQERSGSRMSRSKSRCSDVTTRSKSSSKKSSSKPKTEDKETKPIDPITVPPKWRRDNNREGKFGEKFGSSITDPRYVALETTLSPVNVPEKPPEDVQDIISKNYVLRTSGKFDSSAKSKMMHARFIALLLEKDLTNGF